MVGRFSMQALKLPTPRLRNQYLGQAATEQLSSSLLSSPELMPRGLTRKTPNPLHLGSVVERRLSATHSKLTFVDARHCASAHPPKRFSFTGRSVFFFLGEILADSQSQPAGTARITFLSEGFLIQRVGRNGLHKSVGGVGNKQDRGHSASKNYGEKEKKEQRLRLGIHL